MSDLFGNHIVGFPTRRLICCGLIIILVDRYGWYTCIIKDKLFENAEYVIFSQ